MLEYEELGKEGIKWDLIAFVCTFSQQASHGVGGSPGSFLPDTYVSLPACSIPGQET